MKKKSILKKSIGCALSAALAVSTFSYLEARLKPRPINLSAFTNLTSNITFLTQNSSVDSQDLLKVAVTESIVNVIEKELRAEINKTRVSAVKELQKSIEFKNPTVEKNWNDIGVKIKAPIQYGQKLLLKKSLNTRVISRYEINNTELVKLSGIKNFSHRYETFSNVQIDSVDGEQQIKEKVAVVSVSDMTEDTVNIKLSSVKENVVDEVVENDSAVAITPTENDDLVVFDYPSKEDPKNKKIFDAPISNSVKKAIEREVKLTESPKLPEISRKKMIDSSTIASDKEVLKEAMDNADSVVYEYSAPARISKDITSKDSTSNFMTKEDDQVVQTEFTIKAKEVNLNTQKIKTLYGYEFVPDYDRMERADDQAAGEIKLGYSLAGDLNIQTGVVQSHGLIPTRVELDLAKSGMNIPLLNEEGIQKFLERKGLDIVGNLIMVAIDENIQDVELDSSFGAKLYFNKNLKHLESKNGAQYVMFLGVKTGNVLMRYLLNNQESAQKIIYVGDGEMYYEDPSFIESKEKFILLPLEVCWEKVKELNIDGSQISFYGSKNSAKKRAISAYEVSIPESVDNSRKYLEFKHLGASLFVGTNKEKDLEIPGQDFINKVLQVNESSEIGNRCMVQINLKKDLRDLKVSGKNASGEMFTESTFLDSDGNFSRDNSEMAEKIFISGDMEGIFNVRLDYSDGSTEFVKTFCSEGAYLVEQL